MFHALARATKAALTAATVGVIVIGLAFGTAILADAAPKKFNQSEEGLKMMCDRYGGTFSPSGESSGAMCSWKDGSDTVCDTKQQCEIVEPMNSQRDPRLPMLTSGGWLSEGWLQPVG